MINIFLLCLLWIKQSRLMIISDRNQTNAIILQLNTSLLTAVTNIQSLSPGLEISVRDAHLVKFNGVKWIGEFEGRH